jgi:hypothetical protein
VADRRDAVKWVASAWNRNVDEGIYCELLFAVSLDRYTQDRRRFIDGYGICVYLNVAD